MSATKLKRWEITASTGSHFDVLDGIRGMAILMVVVFHTFFTNPGQSFVSEIIGHAIRGGWMGVPIFFVLSGFLITYPFFKGRRDDPKFFYAHGYAWRRLAKIAPPFYLSLALFVAFYWFRLHDPEYLRAALLWAAGLEGYLMPTVPFNLSYWSLIVEAHFYLLVPLLFFMTRRLALRQTTIFLFLFFILLPLGLRLAAWQGEKLFADGSHLRFFLERFPLCQLDYFSWGVGFAGFYAEVEFIREKYRKLAWVGYLGLGLLAATLALWSFACLKFGIHDESSLWSIETFRFLSAFSGFLLLFFVFNPAGGGSKIVGCAGLQFIGIVSYEWFLFHTPIVAWFKESVGHTNGSVLAYAWRTIVPLVATFIFSALVYRYFSLPILNRVRDSLKKAKAV